MWLEGINDPRDLKKVPIEKLPELAREVRERIVAVVSKTGGHLASSLGVVELTIALHYCFQAPEDTIIWDVGHQTYAHKILTGRNVRFDTLRQRDGIAGFPCKQESVYDPFSTGHSSTAVSLALGKAISRDLNGGKEKVVAIIGDGALTGGMCFEALNQAGHLNRDIIVVLNSNDLAIAPSVGALSTYLNKIISKPIFNRFKEARESFLKQRLPRIGPRLLKLVDRFEEMLKGLIVPGIFFEEMGFKYFGPLDGHDTALMISTLKNIYSLKGPRLLHVVTKKGKGFAPAEVEPVRFHGTTCFDIASGEVTGAQDKKEATFTDIFGASLLELASKNKKIVAITAAMPEGTGLRCFADTYPDRFFDVGIAEQHAVGFAAGLAHGGLKPYVAVYSTFLQRAYDQIIEEACLQNLGIVLCVDRAGIVGEDGPTHHGIFDIAYLRHLPNLVVMAAADKEDLEAMLVFAQSQEGPVSIRYPRGVADLRPETLVFSPVRFGKAEVLRAGSDVVLFAFGSMVYPSLAAADILRDENILATVVNARFVKPLDETLVFELYDRCRAFLTIEEGVLKGGFGSAVLEVLETGSRLHEARKTFKRLGLPNEFITFDKRKALLEKYGLNPRQIAAAAKEALQK
ncbi:MAG: 1-deoxy-D-xylulose-5-phosphate synthase [Candidatus Omnitrophica bacterium CG1_02_44_16]|nr:MAG: 1-deoxy-D-xylulose-5-phosphate synthase [Candidatus Omnitrophica bacterium CG1_02_44_16]PIY82719.1 MAG: 1-deoxy-D-xylulose-5-phosphate synthase [Candidatus Omnitrophica bacterium CG_4_10_14_0_8_um_filter_44_12]PIZ84879.1 MAG: 1-deoxy-D-xylulose-5-phosphate synthase [Candidatus Omnitrophica bacterium CG_4_10_14_0_2_um_filter_44_9]